MMGRFVDENGFPYDDCDGKQKMTDSETAKAMRCCMTAKTRLDCEILSCPACLEKGCYYFLRTDEDFEGVIFAELIKDALALIKRQQAEIERLTDLNKVLERDVFNAEMNLDLLQRNIDEFRECDAEVKFRKKKIQVEAVKEFAERLIGKAKSTRERFLLERMIATVTRELIGEDRGKEDPLGTDLSADIVSSVLRHCASGRCSDCMLYDANDEDCSCSKTLKIRAAELLERPSTVTPQQDAITGGK